MGNGNQMTGANYDINLFSQKYEESHCEDGHKIILSIINFLYKYHYKSEVVVGSHCINNGISSMNPIVEMRQSLYCLISTTLFLICTWHLYISMGPGAHFTNNFSITIQMWWKFYFALIQILIKWSLQYLAHGTTAGLSWHVPNFVAIWSPVIELKLIEISIEFELWWKNR